MALYWNWGWSTSIREGIVEIYNSKGLYICCVEDCHNFKAGYLLLILYGVKLLVTDKLGKNKKIPVVQENWIFDFEG
jgi:hypothetical protein